MLVRLTFGIGPDAKTNILKQIELTLPIGRLTVAYWPRLIPINAFSRTDQRLVGPCTVHELPEFVHD